MFAATAQIIRDIDRRAWEEYGISGAVLMENAGRGATRVLLDCFAGVRQTGAVIVCGTGNNGGDGFVIARHLANQGVEVDVFIVGGVNKVREGESVGNLAVIKKMGIPVVLVQSDEDVAALADSIRKRGVAIDALLGTGLEREVTGVFARVIGAVNEAGSIFAVDIPSGISSDTGRVMGTAVRADVTVTFALPKVGCLVYPGAEYVGRLIVLDISIPRRLVEAVKITDSVLGPDHFLPVTKRRRPTAHKGDFGHLLIVSGSMGKMGAAALCGKGALVAGAGLVTVGVPESQLSIVAAKLTEAMTEPLPDEAGALGRTAFERIAAVIEGKSAVAIGPGIGTGTGAYETTRRLISEVSLPMVIDADGLNVIARDVDILKRKKSSIILTPHPGEMGRLIGKTAREVEQDRLGLSRSFAAAYGVWIVLKGARTIIASPEGDIFISTGGNPGMASGGMGDLLTGLIGGFLAATGDVMASVCAGVFVHAAAGDAAARRVGEISLTAGDVLTDVSGVINTLYRGVTPPVNGMEEAF